MLPGADPVAFSPVGGAGILPTGLAGPAPFYFSDRGWSGEPDDTIWPNRHFAPRVEQALNLSRSIPVSPLDQQRVVPIAGSLSLLNADGGLDAMVSDMAIDGREVEIRVGSPLYDGSQFETLFKGTAGGWNVADQGRIELNLRDLVWPLDRPIQPNLYGGTGGLDGSADLAGTPKPLTFGRARNVPLKLIDPVNLIYQFHDGAAGGVTALYVKGATWTPSVDVGDIMLAAPAAGCFATQLSGGYVRLGSSPAGGTVTADVIGDNTWGVAAMTTAAIVYRILRHRLDLADGLMDSSSFMALNLAWPGIIGLHVPSQTTSAVQVLNRLLGPVLGFLNHGRNGRLRVGTLALSALSGPLAATPKLTLDSRDILEISRVPLPDTINPPFWRASIGWGINWNTMAVEDIAGSVFDTEPDRFQFLTSQIRYTPWEDAAVIVRHPEAQDIFVDSLFDEKPDADLLGATIGAFYGEMRTMARLRCMQQGYLLETNEVIRVDNPRYGLAGGRSVVVAGVDLDLQTRSSSILIMW